MKYKYSIIMVSITLFSIVAYSLTNRSCSDNIIDDIIINESPEPEQQEQVITPTIEVNFNSENRPEMRTMQELHGRGLKWIDLAIDTALFNRYGEDISTWGERRYGLYRFERVENMHVNASDTVYGLINSIIEKEKRARDNGIVDYVFWNRSDTVEFTPSRRKIKLTGDVYYHPIRAIESVPARLLSSGQINQLPMMYWEPYCEENVRSYGFILIMRRDKVVDAKFIRFYNCILPPERIANNDTFE